MTRFIPRDKLSKKERKKLDSQKRLYWPIPPASKVFDSKKDYRRKKKSQDDQRDWYPGTLPVAT